MVQEPGECRPLQDRKKIHFNRIKHPMKRAVSRWLRCEQSKLSRQENYHTAIALFKLQLKLKCHRA